MITVETAIAAYMRYHDVNSRPNSIRAFKFTLTKFCHEFASKEIGALSGDEVFAFLESLTTGNKQSTRNSRAGHLSALFNFVGDTLDEAVPNPCSKGLIKKLYKCPRSTSPTLLDKEIIDEIIYTAKGRNRLILELMGRTAMRIGEVIAIRPRTLNQEMNTISIENPKSGRSGEVVYISQKIMNKLASYVRENSIDKDRRVFPIAYSTAYRMVRRLGVNAGVKISPHDFRRHAATQASRANVPLEIVSKVILRHADIATTQRYLGKVSPVEASHMIESFLM